MKQEREKLDSCLSGAQKAGLGITSLRTLLAIRGGATHKLTDLANSVEVSSAAMTGTADRLEKAGYAVRVTVTGDRRVVRLGITEKGESILSLITNS